MQYTYEQFIRISENSETVRLSNYQDLKDSYHKLLRDHHPDKNGGQADKGKIQLITEAWKKIQSKLNEVAGERPFVDSSAPADVPSSSAPRGAPSSSAPRGAPSSSAPRGASSSSAEGAKWSIEGVRYDPKTKKFSRPLCERETIIKEVPNKYTLSLVDVKVDPTTGRPLRSKHPIKKIYEFSEGGVAKLILHNERYTNSERFGPIDVEWFFRGGSGILMLLATGYRRQDRHYYVEENSSQKITVTYRSGDRTEVSGVKLLAHPSLYIGAPPAIVEMGPDFRLQRKNKNGDVASYSGVRLNGKYNFVPTTDSKVKVIFRNMTLENVNVKVANDAEYGVIVGSKANDSLIRIEGKNLTRLLSHIDEFKFDIFKSHELFFTSCQEGSLTLLPRTPSSCVSVVYSGFKLNRDGKIIESENTNLELKKSSGATVRYRGLKFHGNVLHLGNDLFNPFCFAYRKTSYESIDIEEESPSGEKTCYRGVSIRFDKNGVKKQLSSGEPFTFTQSSKAVSRQMIGVHRDSFDRFYTPKGASSTIKTQLYAKDILVLLGGSENLRGYSYNS